jgi:hypothetical protein
MIGRLRHALSWLPVAMLACTGFNPYAGRGDSGTVTHEAGSTSPPEAGVDAAAHDAAMTCPAMAWGGAASGTSCQTRQLISIVPHAGAVHSIHLSRGFGDGVALLYDSTTATVDTLTLAMLDPSTLRVTTSKTLASAPAFDATALAYDRTGTLSVAYHAGRGDPVAYIAMDAGLSPANTVNVVSDAGVSALALSSVPQNGGDGGVGPLGLVAGSVGLAWYAAPPEVGDFANSVLHLFARALPPGLQWTEVETYGYTSVSGELSLHENPQAGVVAAGITNTGQTMVPNALCTWQMAGRQTYCGFDNTLYGLSLTTEPGATHVVYTLEDPETQETTLILATDTDGSYTFPGLATIASFPLASPGAPATPRAVMAGGNVTTALAYLQADGRYRLAYVTWHASQSTATIEDVTTVGSATAKGPPFDAVLEPSGAVTMAIFDATSGSILLARAVPSSPDAGPSGP